MTSYEVICPLCRTALEVEQQEMGKPAICPSCNKKIKLPFATEKPTAYQNIITAKNTLQKKYTQAKPAITKTTKITICVLHKLWKILAFIIRIFRIVFGALFSGKNKKNYIWGKEPASQKQLGFIAHLGGNPDPCLTMAEASEVIDQLLSNRPINPTQNNKTKR